MSDELRERVAEAIYRDLMSRTGKTPQWESEPVGLREAYLSAADAVLAAICERHAIVELPEPGNESGYLTWRFAHHAKSVVWTAHRNAEGVASTGGGAPLVMVQNVEPGELLPDQARALAAALLAAADAAEREQ